MNARLAALAIALGGAAFADGSRAGSLRALVVDANTGVVLLASNADAPHAPASLAKIMTLYLAFDGLKRGRFTLDTRWPVSRHAAAQPASKIHLSVGEQVRVRDLVSAVVVKSANDAAVVIAEGIAGSEAHFARLMNATGRRLGMRRTRFVNATGLDSAGQETTARDMAVLARALLRHHPVHYVHFSRAQMHYRGRYYRTSNRLLRRHWPVDGMKIGYTTRAGYSFVASASVGDRRILAVILGERSAAARFAGAERLISLGFARARGSQKAHARKNGIVATVGAFSALDLMKEPVLSAAARRAPATADDDHERRAVPAAWRLPAPNAPSPR